MNDSRSRTKSFSPYDKSSSEKAELDEAVALVDNMRKSKKTETDDKGSIKRLIEKAAAIKTGSVIQNEQKPIDKTEPNDPSETDEQIVKKVEMARRMNAKISKTGKLSTESSIDEILNEAIDDLF
jgi:hypothetical protein